MTYAYCIKCDGALKAPLLSNAIMGSIVCGCGEHRLLDDDERRRVLETLDEALAALEKS